MIEVVKNVARQLGVYPLARAAYFAARENRIYRGLDDLIFDARYRDVRRLPMDVDGVQLVFSTEDDFSKHWFLPRYDGGRIHEPHVTRLLMREMRRSKCFADVGALMGYYSLIASKLMPSGSVFAFGLDGFNHSLLEKNIALNGAQNIRAIHAAVADKPGTLQYRRSENTRGGIFKLAKPDTKIDAKLLRPVSAITLDETFSKGDVPDLVKIDVEGAEILVVRGMMGILERHHPLVFLEIHPNTIQGFGATSRDIVEIMRGLGYRLFEIENRRGRGYLKKIEDEVVHNVMVYCVPPQREVIEEGYC